MDLQDGFQDGTVVICENQTKGKGTNGRTWIATPGKNLTFSFLLKPNCNIKDIQNLTIMIAETIVKVIKEEYGFDLEIKYPNDIVKNNKKMRRNTYRKLFKGRKSRKYNSSE